MIAIVKETATQDQLDHFVSWIEGRGFKTNVSQGDNETIVGIIGDTTQIDPFLLESMAAPILGGGVEVLVSDPVESLPYVTLTCAALRRFSVEVRVDRVDIDGGRAMRFVVPGGAAYATPRTLRVGGDWSNAAFWLCAGALSRDGITVDGLDLTSDQGDRAVLGALSLLGARVSRARDSVTVRPDHLHGCTIDVASCPDLVPPLAMMAAVGREYVWTRRG